MFFDVTLREFENFWREQEGGVVDVELTDASAGIAAVVQGTNQKLCVFLVGNFVKSFDDTGLPADVVWNGCFGKDDDVGIILDAVVHHAKSLVHDEIKAILAPLGALFNAGLHQGDGGVIFGFCVIERLCFGLR